MGIITLIISLLLALGFAAVTPIGSVQTSETHVFEVTAEAMTPEPMVEAAATEEAAPVAVAREPYLSEIYNLLDYGRGIFLPSEWRASAEEQDSRTTLTYTSTCGCSLVYLEYLHFPAMTSDFSVPEYITPEYFTVVLSNYTLVTEHEECAKDGLYLYEFTAQSGGSNYDIRYWARIVAPQRLLTVSMSFQREETLDDYARMMFPGLPSCY